MNGKTICNQLYLVTTLVMFAGIVASRRVFSTQGTVEAGNFTHYICSVPGDLRLILETTEGDADLYIRESNVKADYENYDLNSVTCGQDYIDVPESLIRPLSVAIYGHPSFSNSTYELSVTVHSLMKEDDYQAPNKEVYREEEESILLIILKFIFEFVLEIIV
ncbi:UPF0669 protein v1g209471-like [Anneissia japonica]|uniref:UPF0669 protein v1g209471-like n=1 Tax=Anneissia japonica TaxID=1529436 RepID=UPI0014254EAF|nr:UPF0669 protein v1g209471-like [Anneissia japonica]